MDALQRTPRGRSLLRALVVGSLLGMFAFVYLPLWAAVAAFVVGAVAGAAMPSAEPPAARTTDPEATTSELGAPRAPARR